MKIDVENYFLRSNIYMEENFVTQINIGCQRYSYNLKIGFSPDAKNEYNENYDEYAPPCPPANFFDSALYVNEERYYSKILPATNLEIIYPIQVQVGDNDKILLKWDKEYLSSKLEYCKLIDTHNGSLGVDIDMLKNNSLEITNRIINIIRLKMKRK